MKCIASTSLLTALVAVAAGCSDHAATPTALTVARELESPAVRASAGGLQGFGFNGTASGFPTGVVFLTGGGSYDAATASNIIPTDTTVVAAGGGFRCVDAVEQGPLSHCEKGEGVRWDTAQLLASTSFKCRVADPLKPAVTGPTTVVLVADFYRAGDGDDESFRAQMIVSDTDLDPNIDGIQNLWIQGVGCATGVAHFSK